MNLTVTCLNIYHNNNKNNQKEIQNKQKILSNLLNNEYKGIYIFL